MKNHEATMETLETIDRQRHYVEKQERNHPGAGIVFADAFLRGMRDLGYKNPAWALAEIVDNSFQASAETVDVLLGFHPSNTSRKKPDMLAVIDDGVGMIPKMISYAVRWGGTDRENDRKGFGRYGYGLPSAAISIACRYSVYSKVKGGDWNRVTIDMAKLAECSGDAEKTAKLMRPVPGPVPDWIVKSSTKVKVGEIESGTIVALEEIDRLKSSKGWVMRKVLVPKLQQHFGVIYRHWLPPKRVFVGGTPVQAVDPLFLMEHGRHFDENPFRATEFDTRSFEVKTERGETGRVTIRASVMPMAAGRIDPHKAWSRSNSSKKFEILKQYNGLLVCREGRQIDCIPPRWKKFQNYDRYIKIEIDFEPELDEFFGITTAKQQIVIADEMWEKLQKDGRNCGGLEKLVKDLQKRRDELLSLDDATLMNDEAEETPRASEAVMAETENLKTRRKRPSEKKRKEAEKALNEAAEERAKATGESKEDARKRVEAETMARRWLVEFQAIDEGPFFIPKRRGSQKIVVINTDHPFFKILYERAGSNVQSALEVLIMALADHELDAEGEAETYAKVARRTWSERLRSGLEALVSTDNLADARAHFAEKLTDA